MSADRLREAARVLRESAQAAPFTGPWWTWEVTSDRRWAAIRDGDGDLVAQVSDDAADYIATMHPGVGLALADWLDYAAATLPACDCQWPHEPFAVADLILGGTS